MGNSSNDINFKFDDFEGMYSEFDVIIGILEDNVVSYDNIVDDCDNMSGTVFSAYRDTIINCKSENQKIMTKIENIQNLFENIKQTSAQNYKPINNAKIAKLDVDVMKASIKSVMSIVQGEDLNAVLKESESLTGWIVDRNRELDDTFFEALLNPFDEWRQREAERIFNKNEKIYNAAIKDIREDMMLKEEIDNLEKQLKEIGKFDNLFKNIKEDNLFDAYAQSIVGYTSAEFDEAVELQYDMAEANSTIKASGDKTKWLHVALDIGGLVPIPIFSQICDLANAAIYLLEGDWTNLALSAFSAIPLAGTASAVGKYFDEALAATKKVAQLEDGVRVKNIIATSLEAKSDIDKVLDMTLKPLVGMGAGLIEGDAYDMTMPVAGAASEVTFGWIATLDGIAELDLLKILLK